MNGIIFYLVLFDQSVEMVCVISNLIKEVIIVAIKKCDGFYTHIFCLYKYFESYQYEKAVID